MMHEVMPVSFASIEAEQSVLAALMLDNGTYGKVDHLTIDYFSAPEHKSVFSAVEFLADSGAPFDPVTVVSRIDEDQDLVSVGLDYINEMLESLPSISNIESYAAVLVDKYLRREAHQVGAMIQAGASAGLDTEKLVSMAQEKVFGLDIAKKDERKTVFSAKEAVLSLSNTIERRMTGNGSDGFKTGLTDIDERVGGYPKQSVVVIAGRPSSGKTTFGMNSILSQCYYSDKKALVFSLESPVDQIMSRALCNVGTIHMNRMKTGLLEPDEWSSYSSSCSILAQKDSLIIDDEGGLTAVEIRNRARKYAAERFKPDAILIDHLKEIRRPGKANMEQETGDIMTELRALCKEIDCPVILLAQLNRSLEQRADKRPINSDLRDSGQVEEKADIIQFIYRDAMYNEDADKTVMEVITSKYRDGECGTDKVMFRGEYNQIRDLTIDNMY